MSKAFSFGFATDDIDEDDALDDECVVPGIDRVQIDKDIVLPQVHLLQDLVGPAFCQTTDKSAMLWFDRSGFYVKSLTLSLVLLCSSHYLIITTVGFETSLTLSYTTYLISLCPALNLPLSSLLQHHFHFR